MKKNILGLVVVLSALCSVSSFADTKKDMNTIMNLAGGLVSNGDVSKVTRYDVAKYDEWDEQKAAIIDFLNSGGCADGGILPTANLDNGIKLIKRVSIDGQGGFERGSDAYKMMQIIGRMKAANQFKAILTVAWDEREVAGESAEGVSCSVYLARLFTIDGNRLTIVYSHTD